LIETVKDKTTPAEIHEICLKLILLLGNQRDSEDDYDNPSNLLIKDHEAKVVFIESFVPTYVHSVVEMVECDGFDKNYIDETLKDHQDPNLNEETYLVSDLCKKKEYKKQPNIQSSGSKVDQLNYSRYSTSSARLKVPKWLITLAALIYLICMSSFVGGNQCSAGTTLSQIDEYNLMAWTISYSSEKARDIYIAPSSGNIYIMIQVFSGGASEIILKLDSLGVYQFGRVYANLISNKRGFVVEDRELYMYVLDSAGSTDCRILKADASDGMVSTMYEE
jgi:hypothetical protein